MLGNHYITSDRPAEALKVAEPALVANPDHLGLLETVGQARLRSGDRVGALLAFQNLASLASGSAQAQEYLMWALEENGQFEDALDAAERTRSEEHTSEIQSLMRLSYAVSCLKKKKP